MTVEIVVSSFGIGQNWGTFFDLNLYFYIIFYNKIALVLILYKKILKII